MKDGRGSEFSIIIETIETCYCVQMGLCGCDYDRMGIDIDRDMRIFAYIIL